MYQTNSKMDKPMDTKHNSSIRHMSTQSLTIWAKRSRKLKTATPADSTTRYGSHHQGNFAEEICAVKLDKRQGCRWTKWSLAHHFKNWLGNPPVTINEGRWWYQFNYGTPSNRGWTIQTWRVPESHDVAIGWVKVAHVVRMSSISMWGNVPHQV